MDRAFRLMLATMLLASSGCIRWPDGDMRAGAPAGRGGSTGGRSTSPVSTSASSSLPIVDRLQSVGLIDESRAAEMQGPCKEQQCKDAGDPEGEHGRKHAGPLMMTGEE